MTTGREAHGRFLFSATVELFEQYGFTRGRPVGKHAWIVSAMIKPRQVACVTDAEYLAVTRLQADALVTADPRMAKLAQGLVPLATVPDLASPPPA